MSPLQEPTLRPEALKFHRLPSGLLYDPAQVREVVEQHPGISSYRKYLRELKAQCKALEHERQLIHKRLRACEKQLIRNYHKFGKYEAYLSFLRDQIYKRVVSEKITEERKKWLSEP